MVPSYTNGYSTAIYYSLYAPKLYNPKLVVLVYDKCGSGRVPKNLTQLTFRQSYYTTVCSANTSIGLSVGTGLTVGLSVTPSCGKVKAASRSSNSHTVTSVYYQSNTGTIVTWPELEKTATTTSTAAAMKACVDPYVYVNAEVHGKFDNAHVNFDKQCVSYPG
jgi:hypothetical protein